MPHLGIDPVPVACQMVQGFQTIITRNVRPIDTGVISTTMIQAGEATNVVPDFVTVQGTVRTFTTEVLDLIETRMRAQRIIGKQREELPHRRIRHRQTQQHHLARRDRSPPSIFRVRCLKQINQKL